MKNRAKQIEILDLSQADEQINTFCYENEYELLNYSIQIIPIYTKKPEILTSNVQDFQPQLALYAFLVVK
jgi:hypothetical protein